MVTLLQLFFLSPPVATNWRWRNRGKTHSILAHGTCDPLKVFIVQCIISIIWPLGNTEIKRLFVPFSIIMSEEEFENIKLLLGFNNLNIKGVAANLWFWLQTQFSPYELKNVQDIKFRWNIRGVLNKNQRQLSLSLVFVDQFHENGTWEHYERCSVNSDCRKPGQKCHNLADASCICKGGSHFITKYPHKVIKTSDFNH